MAEKKPRKTKVVEAAAVLLDSTKSKQLNIVPLNKALFYLDLMCLRDLGHLATEGKYVALDFGPVVSNYPRSLINRLTGLDIAVKVNVDEYSKPLRLVSMPDLVLIDQAVVDKAKHIASLIERQSASYLSEFSHRNMGWRIAYEAGQAKGLPARRINMRIAMQQICSDDDPWMDEPLIPKHAAATADIDNLVEWI